MITSVDRATFEKELSERDYLSLKVDTICAIKNDPTFSNGEVGEIIDNLKSRVPEIFEPERVLEYEHRLDLSKWDKQYFSFLNSWLQDNFAESRIDYIRQVGRAVYQKPKATIEHKATQPSKAGNDNREDPLNAPETTKRQALPKTAIAAAAISVLAIVVLLLKLIKR